jgi:exoribonuclease-2
MGRGQGALFAWSEYSAAMHARNGNHRAALARIARRAMIERDLRPDFSPAALEELASLRPPAMRAESARRDLRNLPWASIDNDDSRDLDQLTVAQEPVDGMGRILVAIAEVDGLVEKDSAIDEHARHNTTSVYTPARIFLMLPEPLSTDLTSLACGEDRFAIVVSMTIAEDGGLREADIYPALVRNRAQLAYASVAAWLDESGPLPAAIAAVPGLDANLRQQDEIAQRMRRHRYEQGALNLQTIQARPVFAGDTIVDLAIEQKNRAKELIEDFMIAANGVTARFLKARQLPSLRRVVPTPGRWERIVDLAAALGDRLPPRPEARALADFLDRERERDPLRFPDLSLSVVKLLGSGEYVVEAPGEAPAGHFGLAVRNYTHSTAPNRRFPDLITQRLLKAALLGAPMPYDAVELEVLARHCTRKEDDADKVERLVSKSAAALLLESRAGERFDALVTGASLKGTWVRTLDPPVEGMLIAGADGVDVGDRIRVELVSTDVESGYIDFRTTRR